MCQIDKHKLRVLEITHVISKKTANVVAFIYHINIFVYNLETLKITYVLNTTFI